MTLSHAEAEKHVCETFPHIDRVGDRVLREGTVEAWIRAMDENGVTDLSELPWYPPGEEKFDLEGVRGIDHIRDVTELAIAMAEQLEKSRDVEPSLDLVIAGALLHDISKLYEFHGKKATSIEELLGHPYYGVVLVFMVDLPIEIAHILLCHTSKTNVEPKILEARIVSAADKVAADVLVSEDSTKLAR
jgi:putative nucleotidyltransferase with HDIG domain